MPKRCPSCGVALGPAARFCPGCGSPTRRHRKAKRDERRRETRRSQRIVLAVFIVFGGLLAALLLELLLDEVVGEGMLLLVRVGMFASLGLWGCAVYPGPALRASIGRRPRATELVLAAGGGLLAFALSWGYVSLLLGWTGVRAGSVEFTLPELLGVLLVAPVLEEWLCRGVLFVVARDAVSTRGTIVVTAALFGIMHGFGPGFLLEVPHRFAAGLVFGWLRARTDGLVAPVLAHLGLNLLAALAG